MPYDIRADLFAQFEDELKRIERSMPHAAMNELARAVSIAYRQGSSLGEMTVKSNFMERPYTGRWNNAWGSAPTTIGEAQTALFGALEPSMVSMLPKGEWEDRLQDYSMHTIESIQTWDQRGDFSRHALSSAIGQTRASERYNRPGSQYGIDATLHEGIPDLLNPLSEETTRPVGTQFVHPPWYETAVGLLPKSGVTAYMGDQSFRVTPNVMQALGPYFQQGLGNINPKERYMFSGEGLQGTRLLAGTEVQAIMRAVDQAVRPLTTLPGFRGNTPEGPGAYDDLVYGRAQEQETGLGYVPINRDVMFRASVRDRTGEMRQGAVYEGWRKLERPAPPVHYRIGQNPGLLPIEPGSLTEWLNGPTAAARLPGFGPIPVTQLDAKGNFIIAQPHQAEDLVEYNGKIYPAFGGPLASSEVLSPQMSPRAEVAALQAPRVPLTLAQLSDIAYAKGLASGRVPRVIVGEDIRRENIVAQRQLREGGLANQTTTVSPAGEYSPAELAILDHIDEKLKAAGNYSVADQVRQIGQRIVNEGKSLQMNRANPEQAAFGVTNAFGTNRPMVNFMLGDANSVVPPPAEGTIRIYNGRSKALRMGRPSEQWGFDNQGEAEAWAGSYGGTVNYADIPTSEVKAARAAAAAVHNDGGQDRGTAPTEFHFPPGGYQPDWKEVPYEERFTTMTARGVEFSTKNIRHYSGGHAGGDIPGPPDDLWKPNTLRKWGTGTVGDYIPYDRGMEPGGPGRAYLPNYGVGGKGEKGGLQQYDEEHNLFRAQAVTDPGRQAYANYAANIPARNVGAGGVGQNTTPARLAPLPVSVADIDAGIARAGPALLPKRLETVGERSVLAVGQTTASYSRETVGTGNRLGEPDPGQTGLSEQMTGMAMTKAKDALAEAARFTSLDASPGGRTLKEVVGSVIKAVGGIIERGAKDIAADPEIQRAFVTTAKGYANAMVADVFGGDAMQAGRTAASTGVRMSQKVLAATMASGTPQGAALAASLSRAGGWAGIRAGAVLEAGGEGGGTYDVGEGTGLPPGGAGTGQGGFGRGGQKGIWGGGFGQALYGAYIARRMWTMIAGPAIQGMEAYQKYEAGMGGISQMGMTGAMDIGAGDAGYMYRQNVAQLAQGRATQQTIGPLLDIPNRITGGSGAAARFGVGVELGVGGAAVAGIASKVIPSMLPGLLEEGAGAAALGALGPVSLGLGLAFVGAVGANEVLNLATGSNYGIGERLQGLPSSMARAGQSIWGAVGLGGAARNLNAFAETDPIRRWSASGVMEQDRLHPDIARRRKATDALAQRLAEVAGTTMQDQLPAVASGGALLGTAILGGAPADTLAGIAASATRMGTSTSALLGEYQGMAVQQGMDPTGAATFAFAGRMDTLRANDPAAFYRLQRETSAKAGLAGIFQQGMGFGADRRAAFGLAGRFATPEEGNRGFQYASVVAAGGGDFQTAAYQAGDMTRGQMALATGVASYNPGAMGFAFANPGAMPAVATGTGPGMAMAGMYNRWGQSALTTNGRQFMTNARMVAGALGGAAQTDFSALQGTVAGMSAEDQAVFADRGTVGLAQEQNNDQYGFQMASIGLQAQGIRSNMKFLWGGGKYTGTPKAGSMWALENQQRSMGRTSQLADFAAQFERMDVSNAFGIRQEAISGERMAVGNTFQRWGSGFQREGTMLQRGWRREDEQYQDTSRALNFGWQMEDFEEGIRTSSGRQRRSLVKQRDRAVLTENLQEGEVDKQRSRQSQMDAREDKRFKKETEYQEHLIKLDQKQFELGVEQRQTFYKMERKEAERHLKEYNEQYSLQSKIIELQRKHQVEELERSLRAAGIAAAAATSAKKYNDNMLALNTTAGNLETTIEMLAKYSQPARAALDKLGNTVRLLSGMPIGTYVRVR